MPISVAHTVDTSIPRRRKKPFEAKRMMGVLRTGELCGPQSGACVGSDQNRPVGKGSFRAVVEASP